MPRLGFTSLRATSATHSYSFTGQSKTQRDIPPDPTQPSVQFKENTTPPLERVLVAIGITVGFFLIILLFLLTMRLKNDPCFTLRSFFSRPFKRCQDGKLAKRSSCSTTTKTKTNTRCANPDKHTTVPGVMRVKSLDKELEILGLLTDPRTTKTKTKTVRWNRNRNANQSQTQSQCLHQSQHYHQHISSSPVHPSESPLYPTSFSSGHRHSHILVIQTHTQSQSRSFTQIESESESEPESESDSESQKYSGPSPPRHKYDIPSPLLPPPPPLRLPPHRPLPSSASTPDPEALTRSRTILEPGQDNSPLTLSPSHQSFATRSSGVFPCGFEPYVMEDGSVSGSDTMSEDQVLVLPSPPRGVQAYGLGLRGGCL
ncbi:hypothetical protein BJX99DRAFT_29023 [Aspergillus californicus]